MKLEAQTLTCTALISIPLSTSLLLHNHGEYPNHSVFLRFLLLPTYCIFSIAEAHTLKVLKYLACKTCLGLFSHPGTLPDCRAVFQKSRKFRVRVEELCLQRSGGEGQGDVETILDNQFPVCVGGWVVGPGGNL